MSAGRIRRPARSSVLKEFVLGVLGGLFVSLSLASLFSLASSSRTTSDASPSVGNEASAAVRGADPPKQPLRFARDGEWRPKARLPGYKDPVIACVITQTLSEDIVPGVLNATWGSRCDRLIFAMPRHGLVANASFPFEVVNVAKDGLRDESWTTYRSMLVNLEGMKNVDYVFVVNDRTYAIPDNVRYETRGPNPGEQLLFWGRKDAQGYCDRRVFVLSRTTILALQEKLRGDSEGSCGHGKRSAAQALTECLQSIGVPCTEAVDFQGKLQIMDNPTSLLAHSELPAHFHEGKQCCSVLPIAFYDVGTFQGVRTGKMSLHYFFDYFIRDTAVYGKEYMRPLNGIDAGVGKPQVGF